MNKARYGNYAKLIAFFLVAVLLIIGFGFATEGWWQDAEPLDSDNTSDNLKDNNTIDTSTDTNPPTPPEIVTPEYTNSITGLEITEEEARKRHYAFVLDTDSPLYGISSCDLVAEFPTENDSTRLLAFSNIADKFSKIGSISPTRTYISNVGRFFSSIIIYNGNDGTAVTESCEIRGSAFDLSERLGHSYTEYTKFTYTNGDLISAGIFNTNINITAEKDAKSPYNFVDFGSMLSLGGTAAKTVILPFSDRSETELYYKSTDKCYTFNKNGSAKNDMLNDKKTTFKNVFILFADTVTYEAQETTELVMKTIGAGSGYYITEGNSIPITWESTSDGTMTMYDKDGEKLTVNRGNSYIGFIKSSKAENVKIS
ncbi:MAG: DUF3048 C-terminal domain-containing protein [Clostridia bacterium]|nr:DUF3048 C-terminal domain-containing protein [Clostridia bacterium]